MNFYKLSFTSAWAQVASHTPTEGVSEYHAILHVAAGQGRFEQQLDLIQQAYTELLASMPEASVIMRRYLLSDIANQAPMLKARLIADGLDQGACSMVGQPPLDGSKIALWVYLAKGLDVTLEADRSITQHNGYRHIWDTNMQSTTGGSNSQTREILERYESKLRHDNLNLADHCVRTWFFIRDVDTNYKGMVEARCGNFTMQHLTPDTHYIASTGIGGQPIITESRVQMDTYAIEGLEPHVGNTSATGISPSPQQQYLYAPTHLNPTYQYGVTFERGTAVLYGDRRHLIISGTASINNRGEVVHVGDIEAQTHRMLENIETLLKEGGANLQDIAQAIIYLRDVADFDVVRQIFEQRLPLMPRVFTLAPVCRPAWLIEMECIAIVDHNDVRFRSF